MNNEQNQRPKPDDVCPRTEQPVVQTTQPMAPAMYPTSVWQCNDTNQAEQILAGQIEGYVYQRVRHPNADALAEKVALLHRAEEVTITSSGMAAMSLALLSQLQAGDHVIASSQIYGPSLQLLTQEAARLGVSSTTVDTCDHSKVAAAMRPATKLVVVETIANPRLQVADLAGLADLAHGGGAKLLVDNTFATPILCQPLEYGADFVLESASKMMNGHSDVMLGLLCGRTADWQRVPTVLSVWGLASGPFECWLAARGLASLHLRAERAFTNAQSAAEFLVNRADVLAVDFPGLPDHPHHELAVRQFGNRFGSIVTFQLDGGRTAADAFIDRARQIPFSPSLGEIATTLSHPESTSHRGLTGQERDALGISGGTIRLSVGTESEGFVRRALAEGLGD
ncbi:MAG: aminotransferase class I/II-fold pyridoxal phosphate-dependent enzyme [Pirellulaceae bacterium]|jgi:cystathionine beta-lyase/cystathionine gamma-synthase|nr:aminotransferase class I/II-fold pyridoxal phosphate-dependent enzyme [Pirellulaceae bacterium]MDP6557668.1 aminotransferase class I/II-fold pyridoxal phosphate-dependent enzyme [Pirellulaceae bacterium]